MVREQKGSTTTTYRAFGHGHWRKRSLVSRGQRSCPIGKWRGSYLYQTGGFYLLVRDSDSLTTHTKYMRINTNAAVGQQTNNVSTVYVCLFSHGIQAACYIFRCTWKHDGKLPPLLMPSWFHEMLECQAPVALCPSRSFTKVFFIDHSRWPCLHYLLHSCNDDDENVAIPAVHLLELSALQKPVSTCLSPLLHTLFARGRPRRTFRWSSEARTIRPTSCPSATQVRIRIPDYAVCIAGY